MKAKVPEGIRLTIGMIVKNEQKHLRNCLEAMKGLRERVSCELIIADTGSDDDTLEIAREYADTVVEYPWDGDFSAARNATYDIARGEWYMFLDADEYLEDVEDLVGFLNGKDRKNYFTGTIRIHNRLNQDGSIYNEFRAARLFRYNKTRRFINRIHETIPVVPPVQNLEALVMHHGYFYENAEDWKKKQKRNMDLMLEELDEHPDDARLLAHLADSADPEKRMEYLLHAQELVKENKTHPYCRGIYRRLSAEYARVGKLEEAAEALDEFFAGNTLNEDVVDLDLRAQQARILHQLKKYGEAEDAYAAYFDLCRKYREHKLCLDGAMFGTVDNVRPALQNEMWEMRSYCSQLRENFQDAMECICSMDYGIVASEAVDGLCKRILLLSRDSKDFSYLPRFYSQLVEQPDQGKVETFRENQEKFCADLPDFTMEVASAYTGINLDDDFCRFMEMVADQEDTEEYKGRLEQFVHHTSQWEKGFADIAYLALKYQRELVTALGKLKSEQLEDLAQRLATLHKQELVRVLLAYPVHLFGPSARGAFFLSALAVHSIPATEEMERTDTVIFYKLCLHSIAEYVSRMYSPGLLNEDGIGLLPAIHRFGYYAGLAEKCLNTGDDAGYLRNMRFALKEDPQMKKAVTLLLEDYEQLHGNQQDEKSEFERYARMVRDKIFRIVQSGDLSEAQELAKSYLKLKPNDEEMKAILKGNPSYQTVEI